MADTSIINNLALESVCNNPINIINFKLIFNKLPISLFQLHVYNDCMQAACHLKTSAIGCVFIIKLDDC